VPMTNEDERALSIARPNVGMWLDILRRAGHVVLVRQYRLGGRPNGGYRINVDGQTMTIWELWARFRSELGDGESHSRRREQGAPSAPLTLGELPGFRVLTGLRKGASNMESRRPLLGSRCRSGDPR
jgi:hypothetical protein